MVQPCEVLGMAAPEFQPVKNGTLLASLGVGPGNMLGGSPRMPTKIGRIPGHRE